MLVIKHLETGNGRYSSSLGGEDGGQTSQDQAISESIRTPLVTYEKIDGSGFVVSQFANGQSALLLNVVAI